MSVTKKNLLNYVEKNLMSVSLMPNTFPFVPPDWKGHLLLSGNYFLEEDFNKIKSAIQEVNNTESINVLDFGLYRTFLDGQLIHRANNDAFWKIPFTWESFDRNVHGSEYGTSGVYIWDDVCNWGIIAPEYHFNWFGGSTEIVRSVERYFGGVYMLKSRVAVWLKSNPNKFGESLFECFYKS